MSFAIAAAARALSSGARRRGGGGGGKLQPKCCNNQMHVCSPGVANIRARKLGDSAWRGAMR
jgi:hypothetical protein